MSNTLWIWESFVNATEEYRLTDDEVRDTYCETRGELFLSLQREWGRCKSMVYQEMPDGAPDKPVGWVFERAMAYEDAPNKTYIREVWVQVIPRQICGRRFRPLTRGEWGDVVTCTMDKDHASACDVEVEDVTGGDDGTL